MATIPPIVLGLWLCLASHAAAASAQPDLANLQEMLQDRRHPLGQSQAALLLLQCPGEEAERVVRGGLGHFEEPEVFLALATAVRTCQDGRFLEELLAALAVNRVAVRRAAIEALAVLPNPELVPRLRELARDAQADLPARQAALWALGRCGRKSAAPILLELIATDPEPLRKSAAEALTELTGQPFGLDVARWQEWWNRHKDISETRWLESRLAHQANRAHRLEGDLEQMRAQVLKLHQQLYSRLPISERLPYIQAAADHEDASVRHLAVGWAVELLPATEPMKQDALAEVLLRLSHDGVLEVQRAAVLGLGLAPYAQVRVRLEALLSRGRPTVRAAAARSLAAHARGASVEAADRQARIIPLLHQALHDSALEVVIEAAEDLGVLGAQDASPVLARLLKHPSEPVRQAAAQALERVAEPAVLEALCAAFEEASVTLRFSLVGGLARAAGNGKMLTDEQRQLLLDRLQLILTKDADPGVRSRAATVLGECAGPDELPLLWNCTEAGEDERVQEKAWTALTEIVAREGNLMLFQETDRKLQMSKQETRRLKFLSEVVSRWQKESERKVPVVPATERLIQAQLVNGKWAGAVPHIRELLLRPGEEKEQNRRLHWLLTAGEQALQEGNKAEAARIAQEGEPFLPKSGPLAAGFAALSRKARGEE
jgi:HEAT repeat protein